MPEQALLTTVSHVGHAARRTARATSTHVGSEDAHTAPLGGAVGQKPPDAARLFLREEPLQQCTRAHIERAHTRPSRSSSSSEDRPGSRFSGGSKSRNGSGASTRPSRTAGARAVPPVDNPSLAAIASRTTCCCESPVRLDSSCKRSSLKRRLVLKGRWYQLRLISVPQRWTGRGSAEGPTAPARSEPRAEGVGFEPTMGVTHNGFQDRRTRPLCEPSRRRTASCGRQSRTAATAPEAATASSAQRPSREPSGPLDGPLECVEALLPVLGELVGLLLVPATILGEDHVGALA